MTFARTALFSLALSGCGSSTQPALPAPPPPSNAPPVSVAPAPPAAWGIRWTRACSEWSSPWMFATSERLFACGGAVFDRDGALVGVGQYGFLVGVVHDRAVFTGEGVSEEFLVEGWTEDEIEDGALLVRDARLARPRGLRASARLAGFADERGRILTSGERGGLFDLDLEAPSLTPIEGTEGCANAEAIGVAADGALSCMVACGDEATCLRTLRAAGDVDVPLPAPPRASSVFERTIVRLTEAHAWLVFSSDRARLLDERAALIDAREASAAALDVRGNDLVVRTSGATELWHVANGHITTEPLLDRAAEAGAMIGERIVLRTSPQDMLWLERGAPAFTLPSPPPVPERYVALAPTVDEDDADGPRAVFRTSHDWMFSRSRNDIAAFEGPGAVVIVSSVDAAAMAHARSDSALWARLVADLVLVEGSDRWASLWATTPGARVLRGHTFIGGCERADIDVLVRERADGSLEVWTTTAARRRSVQALFGPEPEGATRVVESDRYAGDPSIGPQP